MNRLYAAICRRRKTDGPIFQFDSTLATSTEELLSESEPGTYLGPGGDARSAKFDPSQEGLCTLKGDGVMPSPQAGVVVPKTTATATKASARYTCIIWQAGQLKAVEFEVLSGCSSCSEGS